MVSPRKYGGAASFHLNNLGSVWYCALTVTLQIYIVSVSIKRFSKYIALPWPLEDQPYLELNAYVGFVGAAIVLMPFFIVTSLLRIGNYPNDGSQITFQLEDPELLYQNVRTKRAHWSRAAWRHAGPTASFLHIASAFSLLLPKIFIQAQLVKHAFSKKGEVWSSELDFVLSPSDRLVSSANASQLSGEPPHRLQSISLEFLNYGVALLVYAVRYPAVFWNASKPFAFLFSFQLLLNGLQQLFVLAGFGVLYKIQTYGEPLASSDPFLLSLPTTVLLFLLYNLGVSLASCSLYCYGLQKHRECCQRRLRRHHVTCWARERLWGHTPHVSAFLVLLTLACTATPLVYDLILVYCDSLDRVVLAAILSTVSHLFLWIVLWLFLTLKQRWRFHPNEGHQSQPAKGEILVIHSGQTYQVRERSSRKAILSLAYRSAMTTKNSSSTEDIYWLKPKAVSPVDAFQDLNASPTRRNPTNEFLPCEEEDGDYATLSTSTH